MKSKRFFLVTALLGLFITSCGGKPTGSSSSILGDSSDGDSGFTPSSVLSSSSVETPLSSSVLPPSSSSSLASSSSSVVSSSSIPPRQFRVTFKDEEDHLIDSQLWDEGSTPYVVYHVDDKDTEEWDYYVEGWATSMGGTPMMFLPPVTADVTYWAVTGVSKQIYSISFDSNGGTDVDSISAEYGTEVNAPEQVPELEDHTFVYWAYDEEGEEPVEWPITLIRNLSLTAIWN